ncbi:MAG: TrmH family RNA methyltransferase [Candidatus Pseudothioglobus sp.]
MGSEGKGIRPLIKKTCDQVVSIPMSGNVESLNVSVATAVTLFEIKRQRERLLTLIQTIGYNFRLYKIDNGKG